MVGGGNTGHAEAVKITYDPSQITYGQLLKVFFSVAHDPTELNRQGPDEGPQYRSAVFAANDEQQQVAAAYIAQLNDAKVFKRHDCDDRRAARGLLPRGGLPSELSSASTRPIPTSSTTICRSSRR